MATTGTTRAKPSSVEAILNALRQHPDATAAELAEATGIGRSTAGKTLASLEAQGRVTKQRGTSEAGKATPDRWTLVSEPDRAEPEPQPAAAEVAVDEPAATTETPAEASSAEAMPPVAGTPDTNQTETTVTTTRSASDADQPANGAGG